MTATSETASGRGFILCERSALRLDEATEQLEQEGVEKFVTPFGSLMDTLAEAQRRALAEDKAAT